jgi:Zn-dependent peptidase ImmA (M78 family)/DNA-binding XRE family transcriptional regulator
MNQKINPNMIVLGRELRGLSQLELASKIKLTSATLSKMELSFLGIAKEHFENIAKALHLPESFFYQEGEKMPSNMTYRKRQIVAQKILSPIEAQVNICRLQLSKLMSQLNVEQPDLPILDVLKYETPIKVAKELRKIWGLKEPVIKNLVQLLESKGIFITSFNFATVRVDAQSILTDTQHPIIFTNRSLLGDRQRFSLAYELGHIIMHLHTSPSLDRDVSHEANLFAAEFLMPEKEIKPDFKDGVTLAKLGELKKKWKVSMQALLYRADNLGFLTPNQKRYLLQQFNQMKIRRREPPEFDIAKESPVLLKTLITKYKTKMKMNVTELAVFFNVYSDEFIEFYGQ